MKQTIFIAAFAAMVSCAPTEPETPTTTDVETVDVETVPEPEPQPVDYTAQLSFILENQTPGVQSRYDARNPVETLLFFGIEPGMSVAEVMPRSGWYSKILIEFLGEDGTLIGSHYPDEIWPAFGNGDEWSNEKVQARADWLSEAQSWGTKGAGIESGIVTDMSAYDTGSLDAVLFIRALHDLGRHNREGGFMDAAIAESFRVLKPGGVVGVVQHRAPYSWPNGSARGQRGYMKQSAVIEAFEEAGFVFVDSSEVNSNAKDQPTPDDVVWRLPPNYQRAPLGSAERDAVDAIGESDRMTLKFSKPAE